MIFALHGFLGTGADFDILSQHLAPAYPIAAPDLPGHGYLGSQRDITLDSTLDSLRQEHDSSAEPILLGYSLGGRIALNWALADPDRFKALILISTSPGLKDLEARAARQKQDAQWMERLSHIHISRWLNEWNAQTVFNTPMAIAPETLDKIHNRQLSADTAGWAAAMKGMGNGVLPYLGERLGKIKIPTLLITGEADTKFHAINCEMSSHIKAKHTIIADSGHRPHLEHPNQTAAAIRVFVKETGLK